MAVSSTEKSSVAGAAGQPAEQAQAAPAPVSQRIVSVDALRGFDMFWIVGGQELVLGFLALFLSPMPQWLQYHFEHVEWQGFAAWDLIMPLFLFVTGVSMPFSLGKRAQAAGLAAAYKKIFRRVAILWVLGMLAQGHLLEFDVSKLHFYSNTLQSIAFGYLVASVLMLHSGKAVQLAAIPVLLMLYFVIMLFVPVPGHGAFVLEPQANLALYVDDMILGRFRDGTTYAWILGSLGFAASVLLGVQAGHVLKSKETTPQFKLYALMGAGVGCLAVGWMWSLWFPIIKHIWTSSMVLWAGGWSFLLLALFYGVIDMAGFKKWAFPFVVIGTNAIAVYMGTHLIPFGDLSHRLLGGLIDKAGTGGPFIEAAGAFAMVWFILYYMYRKGTFIRV